MAKRLRTNKQEDARETTGEEIYNRLESMALGHVIDEAAV